MAMTDGLQVDEALAEEKVEEVKEQAKQDVKKAKTQQVAVGIQVHTIMRAIALTQAGFEADGWPADAVDAYVAEWLNNGWSLEYIQHVRTERDEAGRPIGEQMLYVLKRGSLA